MDGRIALPYMAGLMTRANGRFGPFREPSPIPGKGMEILAHKTPAGNGGQETGAGPVLQMRGHICTLRIWLRQGTGAG
jgi:hypothetical protein